MCINLGKDEVPKETRGSVCVCADAAELDRHEREVSALFRL